MGGEGNLSRMPDHFLPFNPPIPYIFFLDEIDVDIDRKVVLHKCFSKLRKLCSLKPS